MRDAACRSPPASRSTQGLNTSGRWTFSALSGRNVGNTLVPSPDAAIALWQRQVVRRIVGRADGLHLELRQNAVRAQFGRRQRALACSQMRGALASSSSSSIPK